MEGGEKIHGGAYLNLSAVLQSESSQSSGVISLPSANRLADFSLTSDLTDSEAENEATILVSSAGGGHDFSSNIIFEKDKTFPKNSSVISSILPYSQSSVDPRKSYPLIANSQSEEIPPKITNERIGHDYRIFNGKSSKVFHPIKDVIEYKGVTDIPNVPIDDIRTALQQNCNMLTDRYLLKDLLKSLDDKTEQRPDAIMTVHHQCFDKNQELIPNLKDSLDKSVKEISKQMTSSSSIASNLMSLSNDCILNPNFNGENRGVSGNESSVNSQKDNQGDPITTGTFRKDPCVLLNSSPVSNQVLHKGSSHPSTQQSVGKHVKFESTPRVQDALIHSDSNDCEDIQEVLSGPQQSLEVLKKLAGLRWGLMGWEDVSTFPPNGSSSSLTFLTKLLSSFQTLQLEKQHLKEELSITLKNMNDLRKDCVTKQRMYKNRETRLIEADRQLGELQQAWAAAQEAKQKEAAKLMAQCHVLKKENTFLKMEGQSLKNDIAELKAISQQHTLMKTHVLEMEELLAERKKKVTEVMDENKRLNLCLEENQNHLREVEEVKVQQILTELEDVKARAGNLEESNRELYEAKTHLQEDLHMLQEQHHLLLKKTVEEQEKNTEAEKRKSVLEEELKALSVKMTAMKTQLHLHYQAQVEDLVAKKSSVLQEQLKVLESNLQKNHEEQMNAQIQTHEIACEKLNKRYEEEIKNMKSSYGSQMEKLHCEIKKLEQENQRLDQQKQKIISTMSSVLSLEHQTYGDPSGFWNPSGGSSWQAGSDCSSLDVVKDKFRKPISRPTSGRSVGNLPHLSLQSSSSSDSDSTIFHEGKQTVRQLEVPLIPSGSLSLNSSSHNKQKNNSNPSANLGMNAKGEDCGECQSQSAIYMKANNPQTQETSSCICSETECCSQSQSNLKWNQSSHDQNKTVHSLLKQKIRKASEIIQSSDLTDDEIRGAENRFFTSEDDEEMARILKELKMVTVNSVRLGNEAPTHDTSLDQDPASLTLHRLSQVSSVLSQYVANS